MFGEFRRFGAEVRRIVVELKKLVNLTRVANWQEMKGKGRPWRPGNLVAYPLAEIGVITRAGGGGWPAGNSRPLTNGHGMATVKTFVPAPVRDLRGERSDATDHAKRSKSRD